MLDVDGARRRCFADRRLSYRFRVVKEAAEKKKTTKWVSATPTSMMSPCKSGQAFTIVQRVPWEDQSESKGKEKPRERLTCDRCHLPRIRPMLHNNL